MLVTRRSTLLMETGLLHNYFGNFPHEMKDIIFKWSTQGEIEPMQGEKEMNLGKQEKLGKIKISFWVEGTFIDHS